MCGSSHTVKNGARKGVQLYKCQECGYQFRAGVVVSEKALWDANEREDAGAECQQTNEPGERDEYFGRMTEADDAENNEQSAGDGKEGFDIFFINVIVIRD